jgi:prophage DNA circulation protein
MAGVPTWFKDLQLAKFRGVTFRVFSHERTGGRRGPDHEYPERDKGAPEDTGEAINHWTFEAFTIGDLHHEAAQQLIEALQGGRGELVHPRWGHQIAICRSWRHSESVSDAGISAFSLDFVDASEELGIAIIIASDVAVADVAKLTKDAAKAAFLDTFTIENLSGSVANKAIADLTTKVSAVVSAVQTPLAGALNNAETFYSLADSIVADAVSLVQTPGDLADDIVEMLGAIGDRFALRSVTGDRPASLTQGITLPSDPGEAQILENADALTRIIQRTALSEYATATAQADFDTYDDAVGERDVVTERIEVEEETPNTLDEYTQLVDLRTEIVATISELADNLVRLRDYTTQRMMSTLEMAWELYGDADRADEIADRNRETMPHPGFVKPGVYRVLAR